MSDNGWSIVTSLGLIFVSIGSIITTNQISKLQDQVAAIEINVAELEAIRKVNVELNKDNVTLKDALKKTIAVQEQTNAILGENNKVIARHNDELKKIIYLLKP